MNIHARRIRPVRVTFRRVCIIRRRDTTRRQGNRCGDGAGSAVTQISCADKESYQCYHITDGVCYGFSEFTIVEDRDSTAYVNSLASGGPCQTCFIGRFSSSDSSICQICGKGMYQDVPGALTCKSCPYGWYTTKGSGEDGHDSISDCTACPAGKFSEERFMDDDSACKDCPDGAGSDGSNRWYCRTCPAGWYKFSAIFDWNVGTPTNDCARCPTGRFQNEEGTQTCKRCQVGRYQDEEAQNQCDNCPGGGHRVPMQSIAKIARRVCIRPRLLRHVPIARRDITHLKPEVQRVLHVRQDVGQSSIGSKDCMDCISGQFTGTPAQLRCDLCPAGYSQSASGSSTCEQCALNYFNL